MTTKHLNTYSASIAQPRQCARYADAWRQGFGYGFRDALRLAAREIDDPHAGWVLSRLADRYALAGE